MSNLDSGSESFGYRDRLPTLRSLSSSDYLLEHTIAQDLATTWLEDFRSALHRKDVEAVLALFHFEAYWRDLLTFTWDFRTFDGIENIRSFILSCPEVFRITDISLKGTPQLQKPVPDVVWIMATFYFRTSVSEGLGIVRLVPVLDQCWKAYILFTNMENLTAFPERVGLDRPLTSQSTPAYDYTTRDPEVIIIGGNHNGLSAAARLKYHDVPTLVLDKNPRIGDSWRRRYKSLILHFPVHIDDLPYLPFPKTAPVYRTANELANWLEHYAQALDLTVWNSTTAVKAIFVERTSRWQVTARLKDGTERVFIVHHIVFATGIGVKTMPSYPGMAQFQGSIIHSEDFTQASDYNIQRAVVIGSGNSGNDVAADLARDGKGRFQCLPSPFLTNEDVTMYQRSSNFIVNLPKAWKYFGGALYHENSQPIEVTDRISESIPHLLKENGLAQCGVHKALDDDRAFLDALRATGFRTNDGVKGSGFLVLLKGKGGHVFDNGSCQMIIDKKIKLKNDSPIDSFTQTGLKFKDRSSMDADLVVFATGYGDRREFIRSICGDQVAGACKPIVGLDKEGELCGVWRDTGIPGLWYIMGSLAISRFHSKHLALQIKAIQQNLFGTRYSL